MKIMVTKTELLKIIRHQCVTCCGGSYAEVEACQGGTGKNEYTRCYLHPYRFGTDPEGPSEAKQALGRRLAEHNKLQQGLQNNHAELMDNFYTGQYEPEFK
jgi:hypothetical protein